MFADLHLHSFYSDGTFSPEEIVARAREKGLGALALTDHDTVEGCPRMAAACAEAGIEFIAGAELTAEWDGVELHLLGYYLDPLNVRLQRELAHFQQVRQQRVHEMVARLNELKIPVTAEAVFKLANCSSPGRPHVGRALVQAGYCVSLDEAFDRFLKKHRPAWVPKFKISAADAIALIHESGGLAVMAHPGINHIDEVIPHLVSNGMDGLECFHSKHNTSQEEHYLMLADRYHLLATGGSDCHGMSKGRPLIGTLRLPGLHVEKLREAHVARRAAAAAILAASS